MEVQTLDQSSQSLAGHAAELHRWNSSNNLLKEAYIQNLPYELLQVIFKHSIQPKCERFPPTDVPLPAFNLTALVLSHTCSNWYSITLSTPELWSIIEINTPPVQKTVSLLQLYLTRSAPSTPLEVTLSDSSDGDGATSNTVSKRKWPSGSQATEQGLLRQMLDLCIDQAYRWKKIKFNFTRTFPGFQSPPFPFHPDLLESASISSNYADGTFRELGSWDAALRSVWAKIHTSPSLREVRWQSMDPVPSAPLSQLTKISVPSIGLDKFFKYFPLFLNLQHLEIGRLLSPIEVPNPDFPTDPVQLPNLETLVIRHLTIEPSQLLDFLTLPNLIDLSIRHGFPIMHTSALEGLLSRSLCTLNKFSFVDRESLEGDALAYLNHAVPFLKKVRVLALQLRGITERSINALFMPQFVPSPTITPSSKSTAPSTSGTAGKSLGEVILHFPLLEDLSLIRCYMKEDGLIGRMVTARQLLNCPLLVLEVELKGSCIPWLVLKRDEWMLNRLMEDETGEWGMKGQLSKLEWRVG